MEIRAREAESYFAAAYGIDMRKEGAFRRRLDHLRTHGCPVDANTGKGRPAVYGWLQLVQQTLALDLIDVGLTPERAAILTVQKRSSVHFYSFLLVGLLEWEDWARDAVAWIDRDLWPPERSVFLRARPRVLGSLSFDHSREDNTFLPILGSDWVTRQEGFGEGTVAIEVDFGLLVSMLIKRVSLSQHEATINVASSFYEWALGYDVNS